jgi:hypothetical protein
MRSRPAPCRIERRQFSRIRHCVRTTALFLLVAVVTLASCSRFDPNAPYSLVGGSDEEATPIPEGTPIIEHDPVPIESRGERIEFVEELVLEGGAEPFYRLGGVDTDARGNIFVYDSGNQNIVAFDDRGKYLRTFGRPGPGPGEIGIGGDFAATGNNVAHVSRNRINVWSAEGIMQVSRSVAFTTLLDDIQGADDGRFVGFARTRTETGFRQNVVAIDAEGFRVVNYADLPLERQLMVAQGSRAVSTRLPRPLSSFALSRSGLVYVTTGVEYDVLALAPDGLPRWALVVAWPRTRLTDERIDQALAHVMGKDDEGDDIPSSLTGVSRSDVDWPESLPALMGTSIGHYETRPQPIRVDGHGHLYVFPFIPENWDRSDQPVDVYSAEGEHLFSGMMPVVRWDSARGDHVYGVRIDPDTEEYTAVRYRLVEPFD